MDRETQQFWRQRRQEMLARDRRQRGRWSQGSPITITLVSLMVAGALVETFLPGLLERVSLWPGGFWMLLVLSTILPGGFLGLVFSGLFVWMIGTSVESVATPGHYLLVFFGSGIVGALVSMAMGGGGAALAAFGLAGAYVYSMSRFNQQGAAQWALVLLGINAVLSGFQPALLAGELGAFGAGLALAYVTRLGQ